MPRLAKSYHTCWVADHSPWLPPLSPPEEKSTELVISQNVTWIVSANSQNTFVTYIRTYTYYTYIRTPGHARRGGHKSQRVERGGCDNLAWLEPLARQSGRPKKQAANSHYHRRLIAGKGRALAKM